MSTDVRFIFYFAVLTTTVHAYNDPYNWTLDLGAACPSTCKCFIDAANSTQYKVDCNRQKLFSPPMDTPIEVTYINFEANHLSMLRNDFLRNLSNLEHLKLGWNSIGRIDKNNFDGLIKLEDLDLAGNSLLSLKNGMFTGLEMLQNLALHENKIFTIENQTFDELPNLKYLWLFHNRISKISGMLDKLPNLKVLAVSSNRLTSLNQSDFKGIPNVEYIFAQHNYINGIEDGTFYNNQRLKHLWLNNNSLPNITVETFKYASALEFITLTNNPTANIQDEALSLSTHPRLKTIYILDTKVVSIRVRSFRGHRNLNIVIQPTLNVYLLNTSNDSYLTYGLSRYGFMCNTSTTCYPCTMGSYSQRYPNGTYKCVSCPAGGFYQNTVGHYGPIKGGVGCEECPRGTLVKLQRAPGLSFADCDVCPGGTRTDQWADFRGCYCIDGFYRMGRFTECFNGKGERGIDFNETALLHEGYWWTFEDSNSSFMYGQFLKNLFVPGQDYDVRYIKYEGKRPKPYPCPRASSCLGGIDSVDKPCETGYGGPLCEQKPPKLYSTAWPEPARMRTTSFTRVTTKQVTGATVYSCFVLVGTHQHGIAFQPQAMKLQGRVQRTAVCEAGFHRTLNRCQKCPSITMLSVQLGAMGVVVLFIIIVLAKDNRKKELGTKNKHRSLADVVLARLKIVIGYYQVTAGTLDAFNYVRWPDSLIQISSYAKYMQLNLVQIAPFHCFKHKLRMTAYTGLMTSVGLNVGVVLVSLIYFQIRRFWIRTRKHLSQKEKEDELFYCKARCYRSAFLIMFVSFPNTSSRILRMLPPACQRLCSDMEEKKCLYYLKMDYSLKCFDETYNKYVVFSYIGILYPVLFPTIFVLILYFFLHRPRMAKEVKKHEVVEGMRFVYENYTKDCWYWEIVEICRKIVLTSGLALIGPEGRTYLGLSAMASGIYAVAHAHSKPMSDYFEHMLQLCAVCATFFNLSVGILLRIPAETTNYSINNDKDSAGITFTLLLVNVGVVVMLVVRYTYSVAVSLWWVVKNPQCNWQCWLAVFVLPGELGRNGEPSDKESSDRVPRRAEIEMSTIDIGYDNPVTVDDIATEKVKKRKGPKRMSMCRSLSNIYDDPDNNIYEEPGKTGSLSSRLRMSPDNTKKAIGSPNVEEQMSLESTLKGERSSISSKLDSTQKNDNGTKSSATEVLEVDVVLQPHKVPEAHNNKGVEEEYECSSL